MDGRWAKPPLELWLNSEPRRSGSYPTEPCKLGLYSMKRIPRPKCERCGRHPAMMGSRICIACRDMRKHTVEQQHPKKSYIPPSTGYRDKSARENTHETKHGKEDLE